jgi:hypothetical protein
MEAETEAVEAALTNLRTITTAVGRRLEKRLLPGVQQVSLRRQSTRLTQAGAAHAYTFRPTPFDRFRSSPPRETLGLTKPYCGAGPCGANVLALG